MNRSEGSQATKRDLLATCVAGAAGAAEIIRRYSANVSTLVWEEKSPVDFVTEVDRAAEESIVKLVADRHPGAVVIAEEMSGDAVASAELTFVADPLDGTTNFLHGFPHFAVSIAAVVAGETVAGAVINVPTGEMFTATLGGGARRSGQPIKVSATTNAARSLVATGFPFKDHAQIAPYLPGFESVVRATSGVRRAGAAALDLADVACGRFDAFWELYLAPWDIAAGALLIREAGGVITDLSGAPAQVAHGPVVAGNPYMHAWLLETLSRATSR